MVLAGFMGSGKTTVGQLLAQRLGWSFADLDAVITEQQGLDIPSLFAERGEVSFRAAEHRALEGLVAASHLVIALGGGAPETAAIRDLLRTSPSTLVVHLHAPFEGLFARCLAQEADPAATARPLLGDREAAQLRYTRRLPHYTAVAHLTVDAVATPLEIVNAICAALPNTRQP